MPIAVFADFQIGVAAYYNVPITTAQIAAPEDVSIKDFSFGLDTRFNVSLFQAQATVMYAAADGLFPATLIAYTDVGLVVDLAIIRLGLGIGPNILFILSDEADPVQIGGNIKLFTEVVLGDLSIGVNFSMMIPDLNFENIAAAFEEPSGFVGISVLYKLF